MTDERFLQSQVVLVLEIGRLGLDDPELDQVAPRFRLLGAERRSEAIDLSQRHRRRLEVQLTALAQVRLFVEIGRLEERRRTFERRWREDRRIDQGKAMIIEVTANRADDRRPNA